ncbi:hypothetical protein EGT74_24500 [Chitinophaga lutea]|uniref:Uncharacterized protein n=1 Tax=Chitinophaga lutea TaxID=2488634 RepID=A0A3N4PMK8_9BACT|nr:hypothetical protein [Chitinophaga lutea]RPE05547.1 hypothetical protein EGT74_24500 [Chitinophaga lutea]
MLKATDIRIGNLLSHKGKISPVECIDSKEVNQIERVMLGYPVASFVYDEGELAGIPLSEEWLRKFEFILAVVPDYIDAAGQLTTGDSHWISQDEGFCLHFHNGEALHGKRRIHYVHQLQNLYHALTGEELVKR